MRAVLQRVLRASVEVNDAEVGSIDHGWLVLLGVAMGDSKADLDWLVEKVLNLRAFNDDQGKMNLSALDVGGSLLVVSQFTLLGDCRAGRRPSFTQAADPELAERLYLGFIERAAESGLLVAKGVFRADMKVSLVNDGPVTLLLDSQKTF